MKARRGNARCVKKKNKKKTKTGKTKVESGERVRGEGGEEEVVSY